MSSTILMVILICVGLALGLGGAVVVGRRAYRLAGAVKAVDRVRIQAVARRAQGLTPRMEETAAQQRELAERLRRLEVANRRLSFLRGQLDAATGRHFKTGSGS